jgi:hypothetical protein
MSEMVRYSESARDNFEQTLANKRELINERRNGLVVIVYWLRSTNEISLQLVDEGKNETLEAIIPNDSVLEARDHPYPALQARGVYPEVPGYE